MSDNKIQYTAKDNLILMGVGALTLVAIYASYFLVTSTPVQAMVWIGWFMSFLTLGYFSSKGKDFIVFFNESKIELQKVTWPSRQETVQTTTIVLIMVSVTGFILWAIDSLMMSLVAKITHLG